MPRHDAGNRRAVDEASWKPCCTEPRAVPPRYGDLSASDAALLGACRGKDTVGTSEAEFKHARRARVVVLVVAMRDPRGRADRKATRRDDASPLAQTSRLASGKE